MRQNRFLFMYNALIIAIICLVFFVVQNMDVRYYRELSTEQAQRSVDMISEQITSKIGLATQEQCVMARTLAHDRSLINWLKSEETADAQKELIGYLGDFQLAFGYNNVFVVSAKSGYYYY